MAGERQGTWSLGEDEVAHVSFEEARAQDAHWRRAHAAESYFRRGLDYEDYAPAYCVGYVGQAQYGGCYEDAHKCLLSNWVRIKGDSRLSLEEAEQAMRAAWDRAAGVQPAQQTQAESLAVLALRLREGFARAAHGWKLHWQGQLRSERRAPAARSPRGLVRR